MQLYAILELGNCPKRVSLRVFPPQEVKKEDDGKCQVLDSHKDCNRDGIMNKPQDKPG